MHHVFGIIDSEKPIGTMIDGYPVVGRMTDLADLMNIKPMQDSLVLVIIVQD